MSISLQHLHVVLLVLCCSQPAQSMHLPPTSHPENPVNSIPDLAVPFPMDDTLSPTHPEISQVKQTAAQSITPIFPGQDSKTSPSCLLLTAFREEEGPRHMEVDAKIHKGQVHNKLDKEIQNHLQGNVPVYIEQNPQHQQEGIRMSHSSLVHSSIVDFQSAHQGRSVPGNSPTYISPEEKRNLENLRKMISQLIQAVEVTGHHDQDSQDTYRRLLEACKELEYIYEDLFSKIKTKTKSLLEEQSRVTNPRILVGSKRPFEINTDGPSLEGVLHQDLEGLEFSGNSKDVETTEEKINNSENNTLGDVVHRLNSVLHRIAPCSINEGFNFESGINHTTLLIHSHILQILNSMQKHNLIMPQDLDRFLQVENTMEIIALNLFNDFLSEYKPYTHHTRDYMFDSGTNNPRYKELIADIKPKQKRELNYLFLKTKFMNSHAIVLNLNNNQRGKEAKNKNWAIRLLEMNVKNLRNSIFGENQLFKSLEDYLVRKSHDSHQDNTNITIESHESQELRIKLYNMWHISFAILDSSPSEAGKLAAQSSFLMIDFVVETYGKDLIPQVFQRSTPPKKQKST
ncbi:hypothetical protein PSHT_13480 [Puccinia striiformis]|uniref:Uncharacterized protein n=1 Tax=Puccinia striiformis TaxID=27350 RepID=A0A2S4UQK3_9BASI|nr:hypothetical protein PSHT_13480 [Puccinia striiformis]